MKMKALMTNYILPSILVIVAFGIFAFIGFMLFVFMILMLVRLWTVAGMTGLLVALGVCACILLAVSVKIITKLFKKG